MTEAEREIREALAAGPTPGKWFHCQPFQRVEKMRTIHGVVPAQRVDFVATEPEPVHKRIVIPMEGRESNVRSEDMAYIAACSPENITTLLADRDEREAALRAELERERLRLVACGVVAMANTPKSAAKAREMHEQYRSASCDDVAAAVDREMALRAEVEALRFKR